MLLGNEDLVEVFRSIAELKNKILSDSPVLTDEQKALVDKLHNISKLQVDVEKLKAKS